MKRIIIILIASFLGLVFFKVYNANKQQSSVKGVTVKVKTTPTPTIASTPFIQPTTIDSATHIELCKTKAETVKTQAKTAFVLVYNQQNP